MNDNLKQNRLRFVTDLIVTVSILATCLLLVWLNWGRITTKLSGSSGFVVPSRPISVEGAQTIGSPTAPVVLVEFSDFQCPFCAKFSSDVLPGLMTDYVRSGKLVLAFRNMPLRIHPFAENAARLAECAGRQGRFKEAHDWLFENHRQLGDAEARLQGTLGLSKTDLRSCLDDPSIAKLLQRDIDQAKGLNVRSTPSFLFGRWTKPGQVKIERVIKGAASAEEFRATIEGMLSAK